VRLLEGGEGAGGDAGLGLEGLGGFSGEGGDLDAKAVVAIGPDANVATSLRHLGERNIVVPCAGA
jgi:hypothetical protein